MKMFVKFNHKKGKLDKCSGCMETFIYAALWKKQNPTYKVALVMGNTFHVKLEVSVPRMNYGRFRSEKIKKGNSKESVR